MKNLISVNYGSCTNSWKPWRWVRFNQVLTMRYIYTTSNLNLLIKFTSKSRSTEFKYILPWNISQMIMKTVPTSTKIVRSYVMKRDIQLWIWWKVNENWNNNMIRISLWRESHYRTYISIKRKKQIQKSRTVRITVWHGARMSEEFDSKKDSQSKKFEQMPPISVKLSLQELCDSKLSCFHPFW